MTTCSVARAAWAPQRRSVGVMILAASLLLLSHHVAAAQDDDPLLRRWVGTHGGRPLHLEFYGDSMLVVNDSHVLDYYTSRDSIVAYGDTAFTVTYWFALRRLLLRTEQGNVITMSEQNALARPITGRWIGTPSGRGGDREVEVTMSRDGTARWRWAPGGSWTLGEWDRVSRNLTFTWLPDSATWSGQYEPMGNAILFEQTAPGWGLLILRRLLRR